MNSIKVLMASLLLAFSLAALAQQVTYDGYQFETKQQRQAYLQLTQELRCPKCQNQNIADSNAPLAEEMRERAYNMVIQGRSKQEVIDHMVARYGNFAHYRPPFNLFTAILWLAPLLIALGGIGVAIRLAKKRRQPVELSDRERQQLRELNERSKHD